jgi:Spy/CpxP family protein refolding chaperone
MTKPWQIWLVLIAIFATGTAGGWLLARHVARRSAPRPPPPEVWAARQMERVADEVQLTPEQKERIKPIVTANIDELVKLRRQALDILDQMGKQIATELTPEQRTKYEKILEEHRAARRQAQELRNARHRADGAPPGGEQPPPPPPKQGTGT